MINILISGKDSYIGNSLVSWLSQYDDQYRITILDLRDPNWVNFNFTGYDVIFHVAGIAHVKETVENRELYFKVNRDLVIEVAKKAKIQGVSQFVFLSSMSVYGLEHGVIDHRSPLLANTAYGTSKLQAEELLAQLKDPTFRIAVLRPPMVYGRGCKGNYPKLAKLARIVPVFPYVDNQRSMVYIDNLCEFVRVIITYQMEGCFFPQNAQYINTSDFVELIAKEHGRKVRMVKGFGRILKSIPIPVFRKVFGDLYYDKSLSEIGYHYQVCDFNESIRFIEGLR